MRHYAGLAKINKIVPEGVDDLEVHTEDGIILIDTKSTDKESRPRSPIEDAKVFQSLWAKSENLPETPFEFHLVINRGHETYTSESNKTPLARTRLASHPLLVPEKATYSRSYVIIEPEPISEASKILIDKHRLPELVAKIICSNLRDKLGTLASQKTSDAPEKRFSLASSEIPSIVDRLLKVCQISEVNILLRKGFIKYVDFSPGEISSNFYLNVDVRPGHITSGQVVPIPNAVAESKENLKCRGSCLVYGPSGSGKSALVWQIVNSTREEICWFEVTNREKLNSEELTLFLNAMSEDHLIGFVLDNINSDRIDLFEQLIEQTRTNENVWILGSIRSEHLYALSCQRFVSTIEAKPNEDVARNIHRSLRERKLTTVPYWVEPWRNSNNLLLEYTHQLVEGNTLEDTILEQLRAKQRSRPPNDTLLDNEFAVLRAIMPVSAADGKADVKAVKQSLGIKQNYFSTVLQRLENEFLILDDSGEEIYGLHSLRSMAVCKALSNRL